MQLANPIYRRESVEPKSHRPRPTTAASAEALAEINAYIAIRDDLFAEAEQLRTPAKLASAIVANDVVEGYLRPTRSPYQGQSLSENDAARERKRCEFVRGRIAQLRMLGRAAV
ncbi:MAG TPA: hypothetical protein VF683_04885 [Chthoniobacterales bacterium]